MKSISPTLAAILSGTYKASCDIVETGKHVPSIALLVTPHGMEHFDWGKAHSEELVSASESLWELRNLASFAKAHTIILTTHGHKPGSRTKVAVFYAETAGESWIAHAAVTPRMEPDQGPMIMHPVFADGSKSSFYPLLQVNGKPGNALAR